MTKKPRERGKRLHLELDRELAQAIDESSKIFRLKTHELIRWTLARNFLGTKSLRTFALENAR